MFDQRFTLLGVVHLAPLPGSPSNQLPLPAIVERALADATTLANAGFDGLVVENFGDTPFFPDKVEPHTVAMIAVIADRISRTLARRSHAHGQFCVGINVLRNDAAAALGIAAATGADFVRVNVHVGAMVTDQGILQGRAHETLRYRRNLGTSTPILADVFVKHASPVGNPSLADVAQDTFRRGGADALVVSGPGTGLATPVSDIRCVKEAVPEAPVLVGSGLTLDNLHAVFESCDGAIVGTSTKAQGDTRNPVDYARARALVDARNELLAVDAGPGKASRSRQRMTAPSTPGVPDDAKPTR